MHKVNIKKAGFHKQARSLNNSPRGISPPASPNAATSYNKLNKDKRTVKDNFSMKSAPNSKSKKKKVTMKMSPKKPTTGKLETQPNYINVKNVKPQDHLNQSKKLNPSTNKSNERAMASQMVLDKAQISMFELKN